MSQTFTPSPLEQTTLRHLAGAASSHATRAAHFRAQAERSAEHAAAALTEAEAAAEALLVAAGIHFASFSVGADGTVAFDEPEPEAEDEAAGDDTISLEGAGLDGWDDALATIPEPPLERGLPDDHED